MCLTRIMIERICDADGRKQFPYNARAAEVTSIEYMMIMGEVAQEYESQVEK